VARRKQESLQVDPRHYEVPVPDRVLPKGREATRHGWHSEDSVEIPTSLTCNTCVLFHLKKKDRRHPLACLKGRKNQVCVILLELQERWAEGLLSELREVTGSDPLPSDIARIEQIIRHRSRIFQCENYVRVAGLVDLQKGEVRNVGDRLTANENALSRSLTEFRQATADRRNQNNANAPSLSEYLQALTSAKNEALPANDSAETECDDLEDQEAQ
jgi:hypothetical protein